MGLMDRVFGKKQDDGIEDPDLRETLTGAGGDESAADEPPAGIAGIASAPESDFEPTVEELPESQQASAQAGPSQQAPPDSIRAFDQEGREILVPREDWRTQVLPGMLAESRDNPEQLYMLLVSSMNDGFFVEVADAAEHLYRTDPVPARGACMWAIVLMQTGRLDEAEAVLNGTTERHGEDGSVLTNLAKVYAMRGDGERAGQTLLRALELEPNQENGLGWYVAQAGEQGGDALAKDALERIRQHPASWRAQIWLARGALLSADAAGLPMAAGQARVLYREALERAPRPAPADLLMQMSGDLGARGLLRELIEFTAPAFVPELHGMAVGNNLIKAYMDTGQVDAADGIRVRLAGFNRPDWRQPLEFWAGEIGKARAGRLGQAQPDQANGLQIGMLRVDGPIWLPTGSPAAVLFGQKAAGGPSVTFLGGTAESPEAEDGQPAPELLRSSEKLDQLGRLTRSLPMFLAEQVELLCGASGRAMIPWAIAQAPGQPSGFVVSGQRWPDEVAVQSVGQDVNRSDYVVSVHVDAETEPWTAELNFMRTADGTRIGELVREFDPNRPEAIADGLRALAAEVIELLGPGERSGAETAYEPPAGDALVDYLKRSEQLLAVRCAAMPGVQPTFLNGEREILDGALGLARRAPANLPARLLLIESFRALQALRPEATNAFAPELQAFDTANPLPVLAKAFMPA